MAGPITDEQRKSIAASLRSVADVLDPPVSPTPEPTPVPEPTPTPTPKPTPTPTPGTSISPPACPLRAGEADHLRRREPAANFYTYSNCRANEGIGDRDPSKISGKDGKLIITATGDTSGAVGQNVKQHYGF
jgi:hypothetical protein